MRRRTVASILAGEHRVLRGLESGPEARLVPPASVRKHVTDGGEPQASRPG
jgi:hypothetical protein